MLIYVTEETIASLESDAMILFALQEDEALPGPTQAADEALGGAVRSLLLAGDMDARCGGTAVLYPGGALPAKRVVLAGLGKADEVTPEQYRRACGAAAGRAQELGSAKVAAVVQPLPSSSLTPEVVAGCMVEGVLMGSFHAKTHKTAPLERPPIMEAYLAVGDGVEKNDVEEGARKGQIKADAVCTARDLVNQPSNYMTPTVLANAAKAVALKDNLQCEVLDEERIAGLGMGGLLGVARGSREAPRFVVLEHEGEGAKAGRKGPPVVLVGKGVTFDAGGINLKRSENLPDLKADMAGAAAVIAVMQAVARLALPLHVVALVPACENLPSGSACKPGDVIIAMNGKSVEVTNTDAEGRLILADALSYAAKYEPAAVIDVATLTGACMVALGEQVAAGLFSNDEELAAGLLEAGASNGERLWRMPLFEEYKEKIKSDVADVKNAGGRYAGVGASAVFLKEFVSFPWAHVDMAGMALAKKKTEYIQKGGTGFGIRTLLGFLEARAAAT